MATVTGALVFIVNQDKTSTTNNEIVLPSCEISVNADPAGSVIKAELRRVTSWSPYTTTFVSDVTSTVQNVDGWTISYDRSYVLRLYFDVTLQQGDIIVLYGRYNGQKIAHACLVNGTIVGSVTMSSHWDYYTITIASAILPTSTFDIVIGIDNPSYSPIRIDQAKCFYTSHVGWHDATTGVLVTGYSIVLTYTVTATGVDTTAVYLDTTIMQEIKQTGGSVIVANTIWQKVLIHVPSIGTPNTFQSNSTSVISHALAGTNAITLTFSVSAIALGKISGSTNWISASHSFTAVRSISLQWY